MIITETLTDGRIKHYSDEGMMIRQIESGAVYEDAVDSVPHTYEETDTPIPTDPETEARQLVEAARILFGEGDA